jgi:hypothetical protein
MENMVYHDMNITLFGEKFAFSRNIYSVMLSHVLDFHVFIRPLRVETLTFIISLYSTLLLIDPVGKH